MSWVGSARDEVLLRIRRQLYGAREQMSARPKEVPDTKVDRHQLELADPSLRLARFRELCEKVGGRVHCVRDETQAGAALAAIVQASGARELALSDAPQLRAMGAACGNTVRCFDGWSDRRRLFECDLGLSTAQWGIAETGTLVLNSADEKHRLVSLVPPIHVALLRQSDLRATLGQVLSEAQAHARGLAPTLTFITGPSRTADIELTLVVGVHGPRELHVLLLEDG